MRRERPIRFQIPAGSRRRACPAACGRCLTHTRAAASCNKSVRPPAAAARRLMHASIAAW
eukprot:361252-Chlamydomonas_euryale.AAC.1